MAESGHGISRVLALHQLLLNGESRPSDLATALNFSPASLTHLSEKEQETLVKIYTKLKKAR